MSTNTWKGGGKGSIRKNTASLSKQSASHTHSACHSVDKPRPLCHFFGKPRPVGCHSRATCPLLPASMSTRQIGHFLLVVSHWSTHGMWNRCMHGSRLGNEEKRKSESCIQPIIYMFGTFWWIKCTQFWVTCHDLLKPISIYLVRQND